MESVSEERTKHLDSFGENAKVSHVTHEKESDVRNVKTNGSLRVCVHALWGGIGNPCRCRWEEIFEE